MKDHWLKIKMPIIVALITFTLPISMQKTANNAFVTMIISILTKNTMPTKPNSTLQKRKPKLIDSQPSRKEKMMHDVRLKKKEQKKRKRERLLSKDSAKLKERQRAEEPREIGTRGKRRRSRRRRRKRGRGRRRRKGRRR